MIKTGAVLDGFRTLSDGMIRISFAVEDINEESAKFLFDSRKQCGWLIFSPVETEIDSPDDPPLEFRADKTPSQRLRSVLRILWEKGDKKMEWPIYYQAKMERLIDWVKDKIEETE